MKHRRKAKPIIITLPSQLDLIRRSSAVAQAAHVRGNAAGIHGGKRGRYGKTDRQAARREEQSEATAFCTGKGNCE